MYQLTCPMCFFTPACDAVAGSHTPACAPSTRQLPFLPGCHPLVIAACHSTTLALWCKALWHISQGIATMPRPCMRGSPHAKLPSSPPTHGSLYVGACSKCLHALQQMLHRCSHTSAQASTDHPPLPHCPGPAATGWCPFDDIMLAVRRIRQASGGPVGVTPLLSGS